MTGAEPASPRPSARVSGAAGHLAESNRVEAFSDGVFAIALTLLVLDLHSPTRRGHFGHALVDEWQTYIAYVAAFLVISSIWLSHHDLFTRVKRVDIKLMCINLLLLLVSSLFPYPAAVLSAAMRSGDRSDQIYSCVLFAALGVLLPVTWRLMYGYLVRSPHLLTDPAELAYMQLGKRRTAIGIAVFPLAALCSLVSPVISLVTYAALPLFYIGALIRAPAQAPVAQ
jgi:uncharacterized membrane protein